MVLRRYDRTSTSTSTVNKHNRHPTKQQKQKRGELTDLSQMLHPAPIPPKILRRRSTKHARIRRSPIRTGRSARRRLKKRTQRARPVVAMVALIIIFPSAERARGHAFETERECAPRLAGRTPRTRTRTHERRGVEERGAARRAVVVHVRDRDARQAELVERCLTARRGAKDVPDERGLDGVVCDSWWYV